MSAAPELQPVADAPAKKKRGKGLLLIMLVLLLAGGGGGAYWWLSRTPGVEAAPKEIPLSERGLVPFEPFMVNLADGGGNRFLKVTLQLVLEDAESADAVLATPVVVSRIRSEILELLTQQTGAALVTPEGKAALKTAIGARLAPVLEGGKVVDVLFSEFVVQF
ncbi:MAG: flagellar basal body-associated FliL family protein [Acidobacteria bacterium]|nr:flagellar basal body-associated FliL family protein [Acidobacteriota bacterium]